MFQVSGLAIVVSHAHGPSKLGGRMTGSGVRCNLTLAERSCVCPSFYILISEREVRRESHGAIFLGAEVGGFNAGPVKWLKKVLKKGPRKQP